MTTKEIIAAFRSGKMSEEEAVRRLLALRQRMQASGMNTENLSDETSPHVEANGFRSSGTAPCDIAVIGISGRFPDAPDVEQFWKNLVAGRDSVREVPATRWDTDKYYDPDPAAPAKSYCKWAGLLDGVECFDPLFFNISPFEAEFMDPQQRLFVQEAWHAFEDAGYGPSTLSGKRCGVFVGVSSGDYQFLLMEAGHGTDAYVLLGSIIAILAGRIGYALNLKGPGLAIDTASSSSLVAVHHACQSIRTGESEIALAGGVAVLATPYSHILTAKTGALTHTGKCHTFDQSADGFVPAEGVAAIVLKPLEKAIADGDHIYGVIKGSACNQDGSTNGITAPSSESQKNMQLRVYRESGIDPSTVTYVECHGTGTKLGDPIEIAALTESFRTYTNEKQFCAIGSSKTNIGHALAACGIIGLIKVLLCLDRKQIPASLHFHNPNKHIAFDESPFYVNTKLRSWDFSTGPRRAAINSFGISGTNAHVVLEEFIPSVALEKELPLDEYVAVPISARSASQLKEYAGKMLAYLEQKSTETQNVSLNERNAELTKLHQIAYTMQTGRIPLNHRFVTVVSGWQELETELRRFMEGEPRGPNSWVGSTDGPAEINTSTFNADEDSLLGRLVSMAKSWVLGRDVDWSSLYSTSRPQRISLPTYPFARERYWVQASESRATAQRPEFLQIGMPQDSKVSSGDTKARAVASAVGTSRAESRQPVSVAGSNGINPQPVQPSVPGHNSDWLQTVSFLRENSRLEDAGADIHWVSEMEKHRGERLMFFYQREEDRVALTELLRQCEDALNSPQLFECSYVPLDETEQMTTLLQSFANTANVPGAFFFLPPRDVEAKSRTDSFFVKLVQKLLDQSSNHPVAGYYCYEASGDLSEFTSEAIAAEVNALDFKNSNHCYRWVKLPASSTEHERVAGLLRERLAYPPLKNSQFVEYRNGQRYVRFREQVNTPQTINAPRFLRSGATYVITGNPGDLGLSLCGELFNRYQAKILLAPQEPLSEKENSQLDALRQSGANISCRANCTDESSFKEALATVSPMLDVNGIIDLGRVEEQRAHRAVVEKEWKPQSLANSTNTKLNGNAVVLVNAGSLDLVERVREVIEGKVLVVSGEDVHSPGVTIVSWADNESGRRSAQQLLSEIGEVDYVFDFSDLYNEPRSSDTSQYARIGFYQELISRYRDLSILYFTRGLQSFRSEWSTMAGARRSGFMKMLSSEYNHVRAKCVDVDSEFLGSSSLPSRLAAETVAQLDETEICYRGGQRFVPYLKSRTLADQAESPQPQLSVHPNGAYVISGGTSGIGLEIAAYLAGSGAKNLALMGITPLPPQNQWQSALNSTNLAPSMRRRLEKLVLVQSLGVELDIYCGPLIDREKLAVFLKAFRSKVGRIDGVVHSAGCAPDLSAGKFAFINKSQADLQRVFEPKVDGLQQLAELLSEETPDFFVAFSSMATIVPSFGKGISDYAAANSFVDDFVSYQLSQGRKYFRSMAWVGWSDVGMHRSEAAVASGHSPERRASAVGLHFNTSEQGIDLFVAALRDQGQRSHQMPCLLQTFDFQAACDTLLWARPSVPDVTRTQDRDLGAQLCSSNDLKYLLAIDKLTQQNPIDFFVLLSPLDSDGPEGLKQAYENGFRSAFASRRNEMVAQGTRRGATLALQAVPWKSGTPAVTDNSHFDGQAALALIELALAHGASSMTVTDVASSAITAGAGIAAEGVFDQIVEKLRNTDREAREQILLDLNLDGFSDRQVELLHALVFESASGSDQEQPQVTAQSAGPNESVRHVKAVIDSELKQVLRLENATVSERGSFQEYGLDSISGMQLVSRLEKTLGLEIPPRWLIEYGTIETLSQKILEQQPPALTRSSQSQQEAPQTNNLSAQDGSVRQVKAVIDTELKQVLRLENATVSERGSFQEYGLDSISGMQLVSRLEKTLGLEIPPRWLIEYGTIETLSQKILEQQKSAMTAHAR
jgi:3-oxoacyl-(acyl-carrier-protein) synthase/acyl carrier protein